MAERINTNPDELTETLCFEEQLRRDISVLERELAAAQAKIAERLREIDRLYCTVREGGQTLHCPIDNQCLQCRFNSAQAKIAELEAQNDLYRRAIEVLKNG
jgi:hypothetical protein